jgi:hypothetical protein
MHQFDAYKNQLIRASQIVPSSSKSSSSSSDDDTGGAIMVRQKNNKRDPSNMVTPPTAKRHQGGTIPAAGGAAASSTQLSSSSVDQIAIEGGKTASPLLVKSSTTTTTKPSSTIPLPKYEDRTKVGQVLVSYPTKGATISKAATSDDDRHQHCKCVIRTCTTNDATAGGHGGDIGRFNITKPYRHMFSTMEDRAMALEQHLVSRKEAIIEQHGLMKGGEHHHHHDHHHMAADESNDHNTNGVMAPLEEVNVPRQDKLTCIGRICNEVRT